MSMMRLLGYGAALLVGGLAGFFLVFNILFSDVASSNERLYSFGLIIVVYLLLGLLLGFVMGTWRVGLALSLAAVVLALLYTTREPGNLLLHMAYIVVTIASACAGSYAGAWLAGRSTKQA